MSFLAHAEPILTVFSIGVWFYDYPAGRFLLNGCFPSLLGYANGDFPDTVLGVKKLMPPSDRRRFGAWLKKLPNGGRPFEVVVAIHRTGGDAARLRFRSAPGLEQGLIGGLVFVEDCHFYAAETSSLNVLLDKKTKELRKECMDREETERKLETVMQDMEWKNWELEKANEDLKEARRAAELANASKSEFLANMSHEIRTPMNAILGFTELLSRKILDPVQRQHLNAVSSSAQTLLTLINDILDLSKVEAGKFELHFEPSNPREIITEIGQVFSETVRRKGVEFVIEVSPSLPEALLLDEIRLRQILLNIVGNAVKFTDAGHVSLRVACEPGAGEGKVNAVFSVEDTGIGIKADQLDTIFEAFHQQDGQSSRKYGGTGLGLTISRRLAEMMNGVITVASETGKGSVFALHLREVPISSEATGRRKLEASGEEADPVFAPATILIADDIENNRLLIREFLAGLGLVIREAEDGEKVLASVAEQAPDLILMDLKMPIMDGFEAVRRLKKGETPCSAPVIALTASAMKDVLDGIVQEHGFAGYLVKPISRKELIATLRRYLPLRDGLPRNGKPELPTEAADDGGKRALTPEAAAALLKLLERDFAEEWGIIHKRLYMDRIHSFSKRVAETGAAHGFDAFVRWGEELTLHADNFDMDHLTACLGRFPELLEELRRK